MNLFSRKREPPAGGPVALPLAEVVPDAHQHRRYFDEQALKDLAKSIETVGQLEPVVVVRDDGHYRLVAGERRFRACKQVGLPTILANVVDLSPVQVALVQATENIARQDVRPCEEATAYSRVIEEYQREQYPLGLDSRPLKERQEWRRLAIIWTASQVGATRERVTAKLKLLTLPPEVQDALDKGSIAEGHAQGLARLFESCPEGAQDDRRVEAIRLARSVAAHSTTVKDLRAAVARYLGEEAQLTITTEEADPAALKRQRATRDKLTRAIECLQKAVALTFDERDADFSLPDLRNDELATAEAKVRGARKYMEKLEGALQTAQNRGAVRQAALEEVNPT